MKYKGRGKGNTQKEVNLSCQLICNTKLQLQQEIIKQKQSHIPQSAIASKPGHSGCLWLYFFFFTILCYFPQLESTTPTCLVQRITQLHYHQKHQRYFIARDEM